MNKFHNRFKVVVEGSLDEDRLAAEDTLDDGISIEEYDVQPADEISVDDSTLQVARANAQHQKEMTSSIESWINEMESFLDFLNGVHDNSIQTKLSKAEADTILDKMKQSEQRKIARVATEIASLAESFKGYLAQSGNSSLKYV